MFECERFISFDDGSSNVSSAVYDEKVSDGFWECAVEEEEKSETPSQSQHEYVI